MKFLTKPVPHDEAADFIKSKPPVPRAVFNRLLPELKARAFAVTGLESATAIQNVRDAIAELPRGGDWDQIKRQIADQMSPYFVDDDADPDVQAGQKLGAERRAELLLRLHGFQAYSAAAYRALDEQRDVFPYWQYKSMGDGRVRATHRALHDIVLPAGDPFWRGHYPPWEWGCRCQVVGLTEVDVEEIRQEDSGQPIEKRRIIEGEAYNQLTQHRRLVKGPSLVFDVRTPKEKGRPDSFGWDPADLRLDIATLRNRYDPAVWNSFESWARSTEIPGQGRTVWEWLGGASAQVPAPPPVGKAATLEATLANVGLDDPFADVTPEKMVALREALKSDAPAKIADSILAIDGATKKGLHTQKNIIATMQEFADFLQPSLVASLPKFTVKLVNDPDAKGAWHPVAKVLTLSKYHLKDQTSLRRTVFHEMMHWVHMHGPKSWHNEMVDHYKARTAGKRITSLATYGGWGKEDEFYDEYCNKLYFSGFFNPATDPEDPSQIAYGLEVPTRYAELLASTSDMEMVWLTPAFRETFQLVLKAFFLR